MATSRSGSITWILRDALKQRRKHADNELPAGLALAL